MLAHIGAIPIKETAGDASLHGRVSPRCTGGIRFIYELGRKGLKRLKGSKGVKEVKEPRGEDGKKKGSCTIDSPTSAYPHSSNPCLAVLIVFYLSTTISSNQDNQAGALK